MSTGCYASYARLTGPATRVSGLSRQRIPGLVFGVCCLLTPISVNADEIACRLAEWQAPEPRYTTGVFAKYAATVRSASEGAVTS